MDTKVINEQAKYWEKNFSTRPEMFGINPSTAAIKAAKIFKKNKVKNIIELGSGQGRDTLFFAKQGFRIHVLDYSKTALKDISTKAKKLNIDNLISTKIFDIRKPLPENKSKFDACYSHMLYCMALTNKELIKLSKEIQRILCKNGINIYTVRNTSDADYKNGIHRGEDLYENDGFIVHFFSKKKIKDLSEGYKKLNIESFEEGLFPRRLFLVIEKK